MSDPEAMQQFAHLNEVVALQMEIDDLEAEVARLRAAPTGLISAVVHEVNEKGGGGYVLARLSDARRALERRKE